MDEFRNPLTDPTVAQDINRVLADDSPMPVIQPPGDDVVYLPCGLTHQGTLITTARVRELTGADEEAISRAATSSATEAFVTTLLSCGVTHLGDFPATRELLEELVVGDRDELLIGIRRATYGDQIDYEMTCPQCKTRHAVRVGLDEIPRKKAETPGKTEFEVPLRKGRTAVVRMIRGSDQSAIVRATRERGLTAAQADTMLLARTVIYIRDPDGTLHAVREVESMVRENMGMADRAAILKALAEHRVGPTEDGVPVPCSSCGNEMRAQVSVDVLFRW